jgi:hypothetical protein
MLVPERGPSLTMTVRVTGLAQQLHINAPVSSDSAGLHSRFPVNRTSPSGDLGLHLSVAVTPQDCWQTV